MGFKNFQIKIIIRVILLTLSLFLLVYIAFNTQYRVTAAIFGVTAIIQIWELISFLNTTNKRLNQFLESIKHADFSSSFNDNQLGGSFSSLNQSFSEVFNELKKYRTEKIEHFNYLQTVVQHTSIGIITYKNDGSVDLYNNAAKRLLQISNLRNIKDLHIITEDFPDILKKLKAGDTKLVKVFIEDKMLQISIKATEFRMRGEEMFLITLQDIQTELEQNEIESWQKLIRVLTHEIMNSITPISSLASTVDEMLFDEDNELPKLKDLDDEDVQSIQIAMNTIKARSKGLLNFVDIYRNLTRIPKPNFRYFAVSELFERVVNLLETKATDCNIKIITNIHPSTLMFTADPDLIDQVMINLVLNGIDAVKDVENGQIALNAIVNPSGRLLIEVKDNGSGINQEMLDKIFMPFYTSKKHGSGIGLSLSRQIMHLHKGTIHVNSKPEEGARFTLTF